jgi:hypothetical protein
MGTGTLLAILVPSILSTVVSLVSLYLGYKKSKEPKKDELWETALKLTEHSNSGNPISDFVEYYQKLRCFKNSDYSASSLELIDFWAGKKSK